MFDMKSGFIQIEIPYDMNWQQTGECEYRFPVSIPLAISCHLYLHM